MDAPLMFLGGSRAAAAVRADVDAAARCDAKVLITGETGVGKDVVARLIHAQSRRQTAPFATLNCAGLPESLVESELFGHERGSFTGAYRDKPGILEAAAHGTVFLDEVGEMSARTQAVLLRFLETGELQRVGADRPRVRVNVRIIAATNRDLSAEIAAGRFRQDLFYRLNVVRIDVPPLRDRRDDIPALVDYYVEEFCRQHRVPQIRLADSARSRLWAYDWPGNVRQLKNVVERLAVRGCASEIGILDLPQELRAGSAGTGCAVELRDRSRSDDLGDDAGDRRQLPHAAVEDEVVARIVECGESFWSAAYAPFIARDLTRTQLRAIVEQSLVRAAGNYRVAVKLLNMPDRDYKRFLSCLRKHDCQPPFRSYRRRANVAPTAAAEEAFACAASA